MVAVVAVEAIGFSKTSLLAAWILQGAENRIGISRERAGQTGLLGVWSLSGAGVKILMGTIGFNPRIVWGFRTIFGNFGI